MERARARGTVVHRVGREDVPRPSERSGVRLHARTHGFREGARGAGERARSSRAIDRPAGCEARERRGKDR